MEFEEYVAARGQSLLRFAYVLTRDVHLAEDLTQAALADAYRHWRKVSRAEHPDAYVRRIVVNSYLRTRRKRSWGIDTTGGYAESRLAVADHADAIADRDETRHVLDLLAPRARTVLVLRYYEDLDDAAIAELMGVTASAVRATASRALATLRQQHPGVQPAPVREELA